MRRTVMLSCLLILVSASFLPARPATTLPELFREAKSQVKLGSYEAALATLQRVDFASQQTGLEKDREALAPSLAFYRGVCFAALGKDAEAREQFTAYLKDVPNPRLDPAMYPKKVVAALEEAQKGLAPAESQAPHKSAGVAAAYRLFRMSDVPSRESNEDWADGPVRFLLTPAEAQNFRRLSDSISRSEFITNFWKVRDPKPETPENEFEQEFERRAAFADQSFVQGEMRGSFTDRGIVFVLLGPPSSSSMRPLKTGDDTGEPAALHRFTASAVTAAGAAGGSRASQIARTEALGPEDNSVIQPSANWREVWRYLRKGLPGGLPYEWVDFDFISRPGYGEAVLQRDPPVLDALDHARSSAPRP